ncbi:hypothetical protein, partial [Salmonella sp. s51228]|uniref:hypothetical protein n=1 Tax=Salmonella sp. s51228 TaxID=3159652 RepID=UPI0039801D3B
FDAVGYKVANEEEIVAKLRQAVKRSAEKKYHRDRGIEVLSPEDFEKQRLGSIKPLNEMFVQTPETTDDSDKVLLDDEKEWKHLMEVRFGFSELPEDHVLFTKPWRQLYLQYSLQELVSK